MDDWLHNEVVCLPEDGHPSQYLLTDTVRRPGIELTSHKSDDLTTIDYRLFRARLDRTSESGAYCFVDSGPRKTPQESSIGRILCERRMALCAAKMVKKKLPVN